LRVSKNDTVERRAFACRRSRAHARGDHRRLPTPNTFVGGDLLFYNPLGGRVTTGEESAKCLELAKKYFQVKLRRA